MVYGNDEFNECPQGKEADEFHERILDGLVDSISEFEERYLEIKKIASKDQNEDDKMLLILYKKVQIGIQSLKSSEISYDKKYALAQEIRGNISDLELL
ncbi:MAG: hypothetical protein HQL68_01740 [Magnetococcales bacterium]|nr:hypothetical protein [Magnetococcales bacterium]